MKKQKEQPTTTAPTWARQPLPRAAIRALVDLESATTNYLTDPSAADGSLLRAALDARQIIQRARAAIPDVYANRDILADLQGGPRS
jgi:hypothetical protein